MGASQKPGESLVLFGTSACHLCEVAQQMLDFHRQNTRAIQYTLCDISDSDSLFERYGLKIPVLRRTDGRELDWPFSPQELAIFLG